MKKVVIILLIICLCFITGCRKQYPNSYTYWTTGATYKQYANIIYDVNSTPLKDYEGYPCWDINNIVLNVKIGWNEQRNEKEFEYYNEGEENFQLVTFASYIMSHYLIEGLYDYSDYKKPNDGIFISEIDKDVFLSDVYKAKLGESSFLHTDKPTFNKENLIFPVTIPSELIDQYIINKNLESKNFKYCLAPVYKNLTTGEYRVDYMGQYDGVRLSITFTSDSELIYLTL